MVKKGQTKPLKVAEKVAKDAGAPAPLMRRELSLTRRKRAVDIGANTIAAHAAHKPRLGLGVCDVGGGEPRPVVRAELAKTKLVGETAFAFTRRMRSRRLTSFVHAREAGQKGFGLRQWPSLQKTCLHGVQGKVQAHVSRGWCDTMVITVKLRHFRPHEDAPMTGSCLRDIAQIDTFCDDQLFHLAISGAGLGTADMPAQMRLNADEAAQP